MKDRSKMGALSGKLQVTQSINVSDWLDKATFNRWHFLIFALSVSICSFDGYAVASYASAVPLLMKEFHAGPAQLGAVASYYLIGGGLGGFLFGALADRIGRKKTIVFCSVLFGLSMIFTSFAHNLFAFSIAWFITGLGAAGSMVNVIALGSEYAPRRNRIVMGGVITIGIPVGGLVATLLSLWLFSRFGWRSVFLMGAFPLLLMPAYVRLLPESPFHLVKSGMPSRLRSLLRKARTDEVLDDNADLQMNTRGGKVAIATVFREHRAFSTVVFCVMFILILYVAFGFNVWIPKLMMDAGFSLRKGLFSLGTSYCAALIGLLIMGRIADRVGSSRMIVLCLLLAFSCIVLLPFTAKLSLAMVLSGLATVGFSGGQGIAKGYGASYYPPAVRSTALGLFFGVGRLGSIFGPVITGLLMSLHFPYRTNMLLLAAPAIFAAMCVLLIQDRYRFQPG
jgi:MFS transporter, AAHS family, benzoate transport protein